MCSSPNKTQTTQISLAIHVITELSLSLCLRSLGRSLPIAPNHDHAQEASDHRAAEKKEDDRDANGPDAGREEGLDEVRVVDEGLCLVLAWVVVLLVPLCLFPCFGRVPSPVGGERTVRTIRRVQTV